MATLEGRVASEVAHQRTPAQLKALGVLHEKLEKHADAAERVIRGHLLARLDALRAMTPAEEAIHG